MGRKGAMERRLRPPIEPKLEGWPPFYYCWACHTRSFTPDELRDSYCDQCNDALKAFERMWTAMRPKKAPNP